MRSLFFLLILLAAIAKPLILILLTEKWLDAVLFLQIFCFAFMFEHISKLNLNLLQVKGRSDLYLRLEVIKKIIAFLILAISIPMGVVAICLSKIVNGQIALFINTYYTGKLFNLGYLKQFGDFFKFFVTALVACLPAFLLTFAELNPIIQLGIGVISAISIYLFLLRRDENLKECIQIIKNYIHA